MKITNFRAALGGTLLLAAMSFSANSQAALVNCPNEFTEDGTAKVHDGSVNKNTAADMCQRDDDTSPPFGTNTAAEVNNLMFFNFDDWQSAGKHDRNDDNTSTFTSGDEDIEFEITFTDGLTGTWSIVSDAFDLFSDIMFVFKDGEDTGLVGFHLNELFTSGGWDTPFVNPPFSVNDPRDVSNIAAYVRGNGNGGTPPFGTPEPGMLSLLGIGLLGMGLARRRYRIQQNS